MNGALNKTAVATHNSIREMLTSSEQFYCEENIYFQKGLTRPGAFEKVYVALRAAENRLYHDDLVRGLPRVAADHPLRAEWTIRQKSTEKLIHYLATRKWAQRVLEVGCGNGWLSNCLAERLSIDVCAIDMNEVELTQARRLFNGPRLSFLYGNIGDPIFPSMVFDIIILASSIQYFPHLTLLIQQLLRLTRPGGEIHILDSPIYTSKKDSEAARTRSRQYFNALGFPVMADCYYHPTFDALAGFKISILHDPGSLKAQFQKRVLGLPVSPFPWIQIQKG